MSLTIGADSGKLTVQPTGGSAKPRTARYLGNDTFAVGETRYTFVTESGKVTKLRADMVYGYSVLARK